MDELIARQLGSANLHERVRGAISEALREGTPTMETHHAFKRWTGRTPVQARRER